jgi:antirestriction protein
MSKMLSNGSGFPPTTTGEKTMKLYVGTYNKYNNGSIQGAWIDLTKYTDKYDFYNACAELHKDESDPEFMFQDFEGFPKDLYSESGNIDAIYEYIDFVNETHLNQEAVDAGLSLGIPLGKLEDAYHGQFDNDTDLAYEFIESTGLLHGVPDSITNYFDYEAFGRDLAMDFITDNGFYFFANY